MKASQRKSVAKEVLCENYILSFYCDITGIHTRFMQCLTEKKS